MIDTHSHIYGPEFDADRAGVVERARRAGVERVLLPNINRDTVAPMLALCRDYPGYAYPMIGLHPEDVGEDYAGVLDGMERLLSDEAHPYVAVGEVGLDFYWDRSREREQTDAFRRQVEWAAAFGLPLAIHSRSAHRQLVQVLRESGHPELRGVFHCFGGSRETAAELLSFEGFALGVGGTVTFARSRLPDVLRAVPLERVVLETDAPYLAPAPHRGQRNESAYVACVLDKLSQVYGRPREEVEAVTTANALRVFDRVK